MQSSPQARFSAAFSYPTSPPHINVAHRHVGTLPSPSPHTQVGLPAWVADHPHVCVPAGSAAAAGLGGGVRADGGSGGGCSGAVGGRGGLTCNMHWAERFSRNATLEFTRWVVVL